MALEWFKVETRLVGDPKVAHLEKLLGIPDAIGIIIRLWAWTTKYAPDGRVTRNAAVTLDVTLATVTDSVTKGVTEAGRVTQALLDAGFLENGDQEGELSVHDWLSTQPQHAAIAHTRAEQNRERQRRFRDRRKASVTHSNALRVTQSLREITQLEKSREEESREELKAKALSTSAAPSPTLVQEELIKKPDLVHAVFAHWVTARKKPPTVKLSPERRRKVEGRLRDGYTAEQLCVAIDCVARSPHHRGENATGTVWEDLALICRDAVHVDSFLALAPRKPRASVGANTSSAPAYREPTAAEVAAEHAREDARMAEILAERAARAKSAPDQGGGANDAHKEAQAALKAKEARLAAAIEAKLSSLESEGRQALRDAPTTATSGGGS